MRWKCRSRFYSKISVQRPSIWIFGAWNEINAEVEKRGERSGVKDYFIGSPFPLSLHIDSTRPFFMTQ